ncbi:MAG: hypothetical protein L7V86_02925, partial [Verrucomicrobiales bacterium]|nr:hypothetical protein [Verrucomicrobiales bacterium]
DYFPILRIDGGKINEILTDAVRKQSRALEKRLDEASRAYGRGPRIRSFYTVEIDPLRAQE